MKVTLAAEAQQELIEGARYYAREGGVELGQAFITEFERTKQLLAGFPQLGVVWRDSIRRLPMRRFPYGVVYCIVGSEIRVLALAHQRRRPGFWRARS